MAAAEQCMREPIEERNSFGSSASLEDAPEPEPAQPEPAQPEPAQPNDRAILISGEKKKIRGEHLCTYVLHGLGEVQKTVYNHISDIV